MTAEGDLYTRATTMTFAAIVAAQIGNVFACRTERQSVFGAGLFQNRLVTLGVAVELLIVTVLILVPPLARLFGLAPLGIEEWGILLLFPPTMLLLEEGRKAVVRRARVRRVNRHGGHATGEARPARDSTRRLADQRAFASLRAPEE